MAGGRIPPDGRPPVAPGVGKSARRHDLEAPATPGLSDPSIQQGDVQRLEQAQKTAPIGGKRTQAPAQGRPAPAQGQAPQGAAPPLEVPDAIEFAGGRIGGQSVVGGANEVVPLDVEKWRPLLREIAINPSVSGPLTTTLFSQLSNIQGIANSSSVAVIDQNAMDDAVELSL